MSSLRTILLGTAAFATSASLFASYPEFSTTKPNGGQRGTEVKLTVTGSRLDDFESLIFF